MTCAGGAGRSRSHASSNVPAPVPRQGWSAASASATSQIASRPLLPTLVSRERRSAPPGGALPSTKARRWSAIRSGRSKAAVLTASASSAAIATPLNTIVRVRCPIRIRTTRRSIRSVSHRSTPAPTVQSATTTSSERPCSRASAPA